jgi:hypothetical protein
VYKEDEYDSDAETLVGSESDDDNDDAPPAPVNNQPTTGPRAAERSLADEPCASTQNNIDAVVRAQKAKEMEDAVQRSLSIVAGARRKQDKEKSCR